MRLFTKLISGGGIAAFFFFSWVIMRLWNHIVVWHLGFSKPLTYLQAAGLWFLVILVFAWVGIGTRRGLLPWRRKKHDWEEVGESIETKIKDGFSRWVGAEGDMNWDELGNKIDEKIKRKIREWAQEE
jgi:hypothetical protein